MVRCDSRPRQRLDPGARRKAILAAAGAAFSRRPYDQVAVAAVAADADASEALVYRYFGSKDELYADVLRTGVENFVARETQALAALPVGTPARERVRAAVHVYLDHVERSPHAWAAPLRGAGAEPPAAAAVRHEARRHYVERLRALLNPSTTRRHDYALWGFVGFLDTVCLPWVDAGCPVDDRGPVVDAILGALEGALGDWAA